MMADLLASRSRLPVKRAEHGEVMQSSQIYVAPPSQHLMLDGDTIELSNGPRENRARPSINVLFRSIAAVRSSRAVGVLLTGLLDDGVAGLEAIKRCGGITVVQDPSDAAFPDMPTNAIAEVDIDHVLPINEMGGLLVDLSDTEVLPADVPEDIRIESRLASANFSKPAELERIGEQVAVACPECSGPIWKIGEGASARFRCHTGHAYSPRRLLEGQADEIEQSMWVAIRALQERSRTLRRLSREADERGNAASAEDFEARAIDSETHAEQARQFLIRLISGADLRNRQPPHSDESVS
jgi:two-component system chemotaxis response regulator CheB